MTRGSSFNHHCRYLFTARKQSLGKVMFYMCLSFCLQHLLGQGVCVDRVIGQRVYTPSTHLTKTATEVDGTHPTGMHSC